jgi:hypothetical protein
MIVIIIAGGVAFLAGLGLGSIHSNCRHQSGFEDFKDGWSVGFKEGRNFPKSGNRGGNR